MTPTNEPVIYFNPRGEKVPAIGLIRRTSMEIYGVDGPDCLDLIYADPTPEAIGRGDLRECSKIAHSVLHYSHPKGDRGVDGPLANCYIEVGEEPPVIAEKVAAAEIALVPEVEKTNEPTGQEG